MPLAIVYTRAQSGVTAPLVTVEVHLSNGLPGLSMVGLPETAVKESKDRVRSAILNSHLDFPVRRITVNLAPADLPKEGGRYDLAIALGILAASEQIPLQALERYEFLGELALSGELRTTKGVLPATLAAAEAGRSLVVPLGNEAEAALPQSAKALVAGSLLQVCACLHERQPLPYATPPTGDALSEPFYPDLADVKGQPQGKRALEIAAAGGHNLLLYGPPGSGKTMLASRLPGILPPLTEAEALQAAAVQSVANGSVPSQWRQRQVRAPHHSASAVALVGGGSSPKPGEISLAHKGILFLDELPEFQRQVLEVLREPLESGEIRISRANAQVTFPADFQLIAAMNPCPCGYLGEARCHCSPDQVQRYRRKISGPLLDRFDLHAAVNAVNTAQFQSSASGEDSATIRQRVMAARQRQEDRQQKTNRELAGKELLQRCALTKDQQQLLAHAMDNLGLSARAYHRVLRVARTIADMAGSEAIATQHLTEALGYRSLDRKREVSSV